MYESSITVRGWLGGDVDLRRAGDVPVASFRLACTPRKFNRRTESWSDGVTQWYTVTCWRGLAENAAGSLRRGDPVVVHGRLELRTYVNGQGLEVETLEIDAAAVGHDLARGTCVFTRTPREESPATHGVEANDAAATEAAPNEAPAA